MGVPSAEFAALLPGSVRLCHHAQIRGRPATPNTEDAMPDSAPVTAPVKGSLMHGKRGLIMGVANDRSLAWGIAAACAAQGAELAFTFQGDALGRRVRPLADQVGSSLVVPCDVSEDASIDSAFAFVQQAWDRLDFVVHAISFADKAFLRGRYL